MTLDVYADLFNDDLDGVAESLDAAIVKASSAAIGGCLGPVSLSCTEWQQRRKHTEQWIRDRKGDPTIQDRSHRTLERE
jgi:hypothetical protein